MAHVLRQAPAGGNPAPDTWGVPQYQYWYIAPGGSWTKALDWTSTATYSWKPAAFAPGTYAWVVYARQQGSGSAYDSYALISFTVT